MEEPAGDVNNGPEPRKDDPATLARSFIEDQEESAREDGRSSFWTMNHHWIARTAPGNDDGEALREIGQQTGNHIPLPRRPSPGDVRVVRRPRTVAPQSFGVL